MPSRSRRAAAARNPRAGLITLKDRTVAESGASVMSATARVSATAHTPEQNIRERIFMGRGTANLNPGTPFIFAPALP
jgi:hypothetical protein